MQKGMQPSAEIAFIQVAVQLLGLLELELTQGEKAVRATSKVFVGAGRKLLNA